MRLVHQPVPCVAGGVDDCVVIVENTVGKPVRPEVLPDILDRFQLRRARRQKDQGKGLWELELFGRMQSGPVQQ